MIGAVGNIVLLSVGYLTSLLLPPDPDTDRKLQEMTIWHWLKTRKQSAAGVSEPAGVPVPARAATGRIPS